MSATPAPLHVAIVTETWPPEVNGVAMTLGRMVQGLRTRGYRDIRVVARGVDTALFAPARRSAGLRAA